MKTPRTSTKRTQDNSPDCSPEDKFAPKKRENREKTEFVKEVVLNLEKYKTLIRMYPEQLKATRNLIRKEQRNDEDKYDEKKAGAERLKEILKEAENEMRLLDEKMKINGRKLIEYDMVIEYEKCFRFVRMNRIEIMSLVGGIQSDEALEALNRDDKKIKLVTLLEGGFCLRDDVMKKVEETTDKDELDLLVKSGVIIDSKDKKLRDAVGDFRLGPQLHYRLAFLLNMKITRGMDRALLSLGNSDNQIQPASVLTTTPGRINPCLVKTESGKWKFVLPKRSDYKYNVNRMKALLMQGLFPTEIVDAITSINIETPVTPDALRMLFDAFLAHSTNEFVHITTVVFVNIVALSGNKDGSDIYRMIVSVLVDKMPSLETVDLSYNAIGAHFPILAPLIKKGLFVNLDNNGLSDTALFVELLLAAKRTLQGISARKNNLDITSPAAMELYRDLKDFQKLKELRWSTGNSIGSFREGNARKNSQAWGAFISGLSESDASQFRCLDLSGCIVSAGKAHTILTTWLSQAINIRFFRIESAELTCDHLADLFRSMQNMKHLLGLEVSDSIVEDDNDEDQGNMNGENTGGDDGSQPYDGSYEFEWNDNLKQAFCDLAPQISPFLTHVKLEGLQMDDDALIDFLHNLRASALKKLSLAGNSKLTIKAVEQIYMRIGLGNLPALQWVDLHGTEISVDDHANIRQGFEKLGVRVRLLDEEQNLFEEWDETWEAHKAA